MIATRTTTHAPAFSLSRALLRLLNCSTEQSRKIARNFFIKDGIELLLSRNNRFGANRLFAPVTSLAKFVPGPVFGFFWLKANVLSIKRFIRNSAAYWFVFVYLGGLWKCHFWNMDRSNPTNRILLVHIQNYSNVKNSFKMHVGALEALYLLFTFVKLNYILYSIMYAGFVVSTFVGRLPIPN